MAITKYINTSQNISFSDLAKTFNNIESKNNIKFTDYYKFNNSDIDALFKVKNYLNSEGKVLNIRENSNIPFSGEISLENFKNSKQLGVGYISYTNINLTNINLNTFLINNGFVIDNYDIIKVILTGNQIYSTNSGTGAINIDISNFMNYISLNLYLETYITGCHGTSKGDRTNAIGVNGGQGESSTDAGPGIIINGTGNSSFKINIKENQKLSWGFGGNGGKGGNAGRNQINAILRTTAFREKANTRNTTRYNPQYGGYINYWYENTGYQIRTGAIQYGSSYYYVHNGTVNVRNGSNPNVNYNNNTNYDEYSIISGTNQNKTIFNRAENSDGKDIDKWYDVNGDSSANYDVTVHSYNHITYQKEEYETQAFVEGQNSIPSTDGNTGTFPDLRYNKGNPFGSLYASSITKREADGDGVPNGSRSSGSVGTGGSHGKNGDEVTNNSNASFLIY